MFWHVEYTCTLSVFVCQIECMSINETSWVEQYIIYVEHTPHKKKKKSMSSMVVCCTFCFRLASQEAPVWFDFETSSNISFNNFPINTKQVFDRLLRSNAFVFLVVLKCVLTLRVQAEFKKLTNFKYVKTDLFETIWSEQESSSNSLLGFVSCMLPLAKKSLSQYEMDLEDILFVRYTV